MQAAYNFLLCLNHRRKLFWLPVLLFSTTASAQFEIDWYSMDGGGEIKMEDASQQWQLSGTLGQWDNSKLVELSGANWMLTGGFWPVGIQQIDLVFRDSFED